ncbi:MAG: hypothetical protein DME79_02370 [Verrucomicrobia bacterium]|nr:MAG: hypothetical protein DME79_02370 [Verrucomicrobiota bacterium]
MLLALRLAVSSKVERVALNALATMRLCHLIFAPPAKQFLIVPPRRADPPFTGQGFVIPSSFVIRHSTF